MYVVDRKQRALRFALPTALRWLVHANAAVRSERIAYVRIDHLQIEPFGVEVAAGPPFRIGVLGMLRVSHDCEELEITVRPPDVLTRSGARAVDACGNPKLWLECKPAFEFD